MLMWFLVCGVVLLSYAPVDAGPTESRLWTSSNGHSVIAAAMRISGKKVVLRKPDGKTVMVPLSRLVEADREFLAQHFSQDADSRKGEKEAADDLPHPLGKMTDEIPCNRKYSYYLYCPKSLRRDKKHPVLYIMDPGGGNVTTAHRYIKGAERNGWILAVSKQSKNHFEGSLDACKAMMRHVEKTLPIDRRRVYTTGFSGGSRMAFMLSRERKGIAGIIAGGAAGKIGRRRQVVYGLCGSNCFNRTDMAHAFKTIFHRGSILRFYPGGHVWPDDEHIEDAITHLNGVFLSANRTSYLDDHAEYLRQLESLVKENVDSNPMRAYMWAEYANRYKFESKAISEAYQKLGRDPMNILYVKGLYKIRKFAQKTFGQYGYSEKQSDPRNSSACKREARKYIGTPWEEILKKMSEDAQSF